ncbi:family 43 glycosylhydrolase [Kamptonema cortianum]|nr:family 43 glycosylhydrolase [Kamptonema cortianum]
MFASFKAPGVARGTQILVSDAPDKPFTPWSDGPVTPSKDECLDGTLFVDEQGKPWMVYCHEWTQIKNGTMCAIELSQDLRTALGKPVLLFDAASCSQVKRNPEENYVTDGPCLRRNRKGELLMLWSSYGQQGYFVATARAPGGQVTGPWVHDSELLVSHDAGHPMLFESLDGQLMMALHQNSAQPHDYALFYPVEEDGKGKIRLKGKAL